MSVSLCTIHHEGGGPPNDTPMPPYSYWIGVNSWQRIQSPYTSWATLDFNHVSLDICLSGSRGNTDPAYPVTDNDIALIHGAFMDCFNRGEVVGQPLVRAHKNSPGSNTVCPGDNTMARWTDVSNACMNVPVPPPAPKVEVDMVSVLNQDGHPEDIWVGDDGKVYHRWRNLTGGTWNGPYDFTDTLPTPATRVSAFLNPSSAGAAGCVEVHALAGGVWYSRVQTAPNNGWSAWTKM